MNTDSLNTKCSSLMMKHYDDSIIVPRSVLEKKPAFLLKVRGDSMQSMGISDGDVIAVRKTDQVGGRDIVVTRVTLKDGVKGRRMGEGNVRLFPHSEAYQPILINSGKLVIEGLFVGLVRGATRH